ncbi:MAG: hypothetical protein CL774_02225 [Chloroflexi bacterium]|nr:hypothetical protein [Chloroflexota bacterium]|tara:strand:- start:7574 stop:8215 length:642 start_codon:yes stop_codon:yes gene_type:complete
MNLTQNQIIGWGLIIGPILFIISVPLWFMQPETNVATRLVEEFAWAQDNKLLTVIPILFTGTAFGIIGTAYLMFTRQLQEETGKAILQLVFIFLLMNITLQIADFGVYLDTILSPTEELSASIIFGALSTTGLSDILAGLGFIILGKAIRDSKKFGSKSNTLISFGLLIFGIANILSGFVSEDISDLLGFVGWLIIFNIVNLTLGRAMLKGNS